MLTSISSFFIRVYQLHLVLNKHYRERMYFYLTK